MSTLSLAPTLEFAAREVCEDITAGLHGATPDLLVAFVSAQHEDAYAKLPRLLAQSGARVVVGCSAGGVIGAGHEVEGRPGLAVCGAILPGVGLAAFHLETDRLPSVDRAEAWQSLVAGAGPDHDAAHLLLLADPFTSELEPLLAGFDRHLQGGRTFGGLASGGEAPGRNVLVEGSTLHRGGAVAVAMRGELAVETIVAQGCRPIGDPMFVTSVDGPLVRTLDGEPPAYAMRTLYDRLDTRDHELFRHSLFLGVVMRKAREAYGHGDFLVRNIVGLNSETGGLVVGASLEVGSVVQFHLRDAMTSADDLEALLARQVSSRGPVPAGGLLFSCVGRGAQLYGVPNHDTAAFSRHFGDVPLAGFFCNGEIGPVQGTTFVHGYTSAFALFSPRSR